MNQNCHKGDWASHLPKDRRRVLISLSHPYKLSDSHRLNDMFAVGERLKINLGFRFNVISATNLSSNWVGFLGLWAFGWNESNERKKEEGSGVSACPRRYGKDGSHRKAPIQGTADAVVPDKVFAEVSA